MRNQGPTYYIQFLIIFLFSKNYILEMTYALFHLMQIQTIINYCNSLIGKRLRETRRFQEHSNVGIKIRGFWLIFCLF